MRSFLTGKRIFSCITQIKPAGASSGAPAVVAIPAGTSPEERRRIQAQIDADAAERRRKAAEAYAAFKSGAVSLQQRR